MYHYAARLGYKSDDRFRRRGFTTFRHHRRDVIDTQHQNTARGAERFCRLRDTYVGRTVNITYQRVLNLPPRDFTMPDRRA